MTSAIFKLIIEVDGNEVSNEEIGYQSLNALVNSVPDVPEACDLCGYLALSPSWQVRADIAYRDHLNEKTVELLAEDPSVEVRRRLCSQTPFKEWAPTELLLNYISSDIEIARIIASNISEYNNADVNAMATKLFNHSDPDVRASLAQNWGAPKKVLKQLLSDSDLSVRAAAERTLN